MRLSNYLHRPSSGVWHFRQRVPADLAHVLGQKFFKRTLHTRDVLEAQRLALGVARGYAQLIQQLRALGVAKSKEGKPSIGGAVKAAQHGKPYTLVMQPDGRVELKAEPGPDHDAAMEAVAKIGPLAAEPYIQKIMAEAAARTSLPVPVPAAPASKIPVLPIGKVVTQWLADIKSSTLPKTLSIKAAAVEGFVRHYGEKKPVADAGRLDVGRWIEALRASGLSTPTIVNKTGYLKGFFEWTKARGYYPHFAKDDNPAAGQILFRAKEKRARRVHGFKAFSRDQIRILYSPEALKGLPEAARWGAWIGLHTGARVAEVGQLSLADFVTEDGLPCIRITNEGLGQSVKNDASLRTIPVHPALIELGLLDRVETLRAAGDTKLFPKVKIDGVNGAGNWLSKSFTRHVVANLKLPEKGKFGFHSLRKTVVQELQTLGVSSEHRAAFVGHDLGDEHHGTYSRAPTMSELLAEVSKMKWTVGDR
jgi:integrase